VYDVATQAFIDLYTGTSKTVIKADFFINFDYKMSTSLY